MQDEYGTRFGQRHEVKFHRPAAIGEREARRLYGEWLAEHETRVAAIRAERAGEGTPLSFRQAHELAAEWYRWFIRHHEDNPGDAATWEGLRDEVQDALAAQEPEAYQRGYPWSENAIHATLPIIADRAQTATFLAQHRRALNAEARGRFLRAVFDQYAEALRRLMQLAGGNFAEDAHAKSLPVPRPRDTGATPWELFEAWVAERKPAAGTVETWRYMFRDMEAHFAERSAGSITPAEAREWLVSRITPDRSARTVAGTWRRAAAAVFGWAADAHKISANPFVDIKLAIERRVVQRDSRAFRTGEAALILRASAAIGDTTKHLDAAKRWVPWLCAYTGARPAEITQLRRQDVATVEGIAVVHLTGDAGTIKTGEARTIPLHAHLVEQGFLEWVASRPEGPLFYRQRKAPAATSLTREKKSPAAQVRQRLAKWVRAVGVTDPNVSPNHGWRHTFKLVGRRAKISETMLDQICGHAPASVGSDYGRAMLEDKAAAIRSFPRFTFDPNGESNAGQDSPAVIAAKPVV